MTWAYGLVLVLLFPQFPSIREIDFSQTIDIDIENELLPRTPGKHCGEEDTVNLQNLDLGSIPNHVIKSDKIRHVDLSFNRLTEIPNSFFLDVPNLECLNLTANVYSPINILDGSKSYSLKTLVLDDTRYDPNRETYISYDDYKISNSCKMTGYFPNLETLHLSGSEKCFIDASFEAKLPRLATLYLINHNSRFEFKFWRLPTTLRHLHLEGTRINELPLKELNNLESLYLDGYNYKNDFNISFPMVNNLQILSCRNCSLRTTDIETLFYASRNALRLLDLSHNSLYYLRDDMLKQTSNLESLILSNNMFSMMPDVEALSQLRGLVMSHNRIIEVVHRKSNSLKMLSLRGNKISQINATAFDGYPALEELDLSQNKLTSLPTGWTHNLENLVSVNLKSNSFVRLSDTSLMTANSGLRHLIMSVHPIEKFNQEDFELFPDNCTIHFTLSDETIAEDEIFEDAPIRLDTNY